MSYENYQQSKSLYDIVNQVFQDYKYGKVSSGGKWNTLVPHLEGVTLKFLSEGQLQITYHRYETTTIEGLKRVQQQNDGSDFVQSVVESLKKEFKKTTGASLSLKKNKEPVVDFEKAGRLTAETSWMLGSSRHGGGHPVGRYLVRTYCVYDFSADL